MAARQSRRAVNRLLAAPRGRRAAGDLSLHRRRSRRGGARQAPHRRRDARPSDAAGRRGRPARRGRRPARARRGILRRPGARPAPGRASSPARSSSAPRASGLAAACGVDGSTHGRGADAPRRASVRPRRGDDPRRAARVRRALPRASRPARGASARAFSHALDGRFVGPGPAGSPCADSSTCCRPAATSRPSIPRAIPTRAATELGWRAAAEVVRRHLQEEGDWPRRIVMDLWASPTLRSGGEDIAHALALMGVRPVWDHASTRVTGFEIVPQPLLDRPRADVTVRISGAFRDTFPDQIALLDQAARAVAPSTRTTTGTRSPPPAGAARRCRASSAPRPARYGAGVAGAGARRRLERPGAISAAPISTAPPCLRTRRRGPRGPELSAPGRRAEAFVHVSDVAERDILDGDAAADAHRRVRGRGAGPRRAPRRSTASTPAARTRRRPAPSLEDIDRLVRGRLDQSALDRWPASPRLARRGRDRASGRCPLRLRRDDRCGSAPRLRSRLHGPHGRRAPCASASSAANPAAARAIRDRLAEARRRGLWQSRLNSVAALIDERRRIDGRPPNDGRQQPVHAPRMVPGRAPPHGDRRRPPGARAPAGRRAYGRPGAPRRGGSRDAWQRPSRRHRPRQPADPRRQRRHIPGAARPPRRGGLGGAGRRRTRCASRPFRRWPGSIPHDRSTRSPWRRRSRASRAICRTCREGSRRRRRRRVRAPRRDRAQTCIWLAAGERRRSPAALPRPRLSLDRRDIAGAAPAAASFHPGGLRRHEAHGRTQARRIRDLAPSSCP